MFNAELINQMKEIIANHKSSIGKRNAMLNYIKGDVKDAERQLLDSLREHPNNGFAFVQVIQKLLGQVNLILVDNDAIPIHIGEMDLISVKTIEAYMQMPIDDAYEMYKDGGIDYDSFENLNRGE